MQQCLGMSFNGRWAGLAAVLVCLLFTMACESTLMREFSHHMAGNDLHSTQTLLERELAVNPNNAEANYLMGNLLSRQQQYEEANRYFDRSLDNSAVFREHIAYLRERHYRTEINAGLDARESGQHAQAVRRFGLAVEIFPDRPLAYPLLGDSHESLHQTDEAISTYESCVRVDPDHYECGLNLAELHFRRNNFDRVIELTEHLRINHPEDWRTLKLLTDARLGAAHYDRAEQTLSALNRTRYDYSFHKNFAVTLYNLGEVRRAEPHLRQCLSRRPDDKDILKTLSSIYLESRNYELVIEAAERLLEMEPQNRAVKAQLMIAYELIGDLDNYKILKEELDL